MRIEGGWRGAWSGLTRKELEWVSLHCSERMWCMDVRVWIQDIQEGESDDQGVSRSESWGRCSCLRPECRSRFPWPNYVFDFNLTSSNARSCCLKWYIAVQQMTQIPWRQHIPTQLFYFSRYRTTRIRKLNLTFDWVSSRVFVHSLDRAVSAEFGRAEEGLLRRQTIPALVHA